VDPNNKIYRIFKYQELTRTGDGEFFLNNYDPQKTIQMNTDLCTSIISVGYLELDSGNWHTGDTHFRLLDEGDKLREIKYTEFLDILDKTYREVMLKRILDGKY
jgi:hypothetical protein